MTEKERKRNRRKVRNAHSRKRGIAQAKPKRHNRLIHVKAMGASWVGPHRAIPTGSPVHSRIPRRANSRARCVAIGADKGAGTGTHVEVEYGDLVLVRCGVNCLDGAASGRHFAVEQLGYAVNGH